MDVMARANALAAGGRDLVRMEVGQPGEGPAPSVAAAVAEALRSAPLGYTEALGLPSLRAGLAGLYRRRYGVEVDPRRIVVTTGSSGGFVLAFLAAFEAGERIVLGAPGYPPYVSILEALGLEPVVVALDPARGYRLTASELKGAGPAAGLLVASPANPTGTVLSRETLEGLAREAEARGMTFVSDEIYHGLVYGAPAHSLLEFTQDCIVVSSFSKYQGLTGWRVGWLVVPERLVRAVERLAQSLYISPPTVSQHAALAALEPQAESAFDARVAAYAASRAALLEALPRAGFAEISPAEGAFYVYARIPEDAPDADEFARRLMEEAGVVATPGFDFDRARGTRTMRFSYCGPPDRMAEGARRLLAWRGKRSVAS
ncbi:MAG: aminotransferase class I/II-fold pyridoxal phosphate-dependent enzyme [Alphaproteobacteria bacterium]|nr:aminotransferase class I/II-fold pyridoxal phosphate-dependent enzyme [Alphaproteobacteria bacterium]